MPILKVSFDLQELPVTKNTFVIIVPTFKWGEIENQNSGLSRRDTTDKPHKDSKYG